MLITLFGFSDITSGSTARTVLWFRPCVDLKGGQLFSFFQFYFIIKYLRDQCSFVRETVYI